MNTVSFSILSSQGRAAQLPLDANLYSLVTPERLRRDVAPRQGEVGREWWGRGAPAAAQRPLGRPHYVEEDASLAATCGLLGCLSQRMLRPSS